MGEGTGVLTGGVCGLDLPAEESSSSPLIRKGRLDIRPSTVSPETANAPAISSSEAPIWMRLVTTIPTSDSDADVLAFATYAFTNFTETAILSAISSVVAPAWTRLDTAIERNLSAGATQSWMGLLGGDFVAIGVAVDGIGVAVGGTGVAVGVGVTIAVGTGVGGPGVGTGIGGTDVAVGGTGVAVGGTGVAVGGTSVGGGVAVIPIGGPVIGGRVGVGMGSRVGSWVD